MNARFLLGAAYGCGWAALLTWTGGQPATTSNLVGLGIGMLLGAGVYVGLVWLGARYEIRRRR